MSTVEAWARGGLAAVGTLTFGGFAEVHLLLALVMVGLWCWYALTYPPQRVAGLYVVGTVAALLVREAVQ
jgi:hypothetical protein